MKKIIYSIIISLVFSSAAMAAAVDYEARMDSLTRAFLAHCDGKVPAGFSMNADSTTHVNLQEFFTDTVAKRYFEEMGKCIMGQEAVRKGIKMEVKDVKMEPMQHSEYAQLSVASDGRKRAVAFPQISFCTAIPYNYQSVDGQNNPVWLSSVMYRPSPFQFNLSSELGFWTLSGVGMVANLIESIKGLWNLAFGYTVNYGVLNCHPTVFTSLQAPTGADPLDKDVSMFCSNYALVVSPDYCGYGLSGHKQHPYLVQGVTARNVIDGYVAALNLVDNGDVQGSVVRWKLSKDFYTDIMGYSQGGSVALACVKYLESGQVPQHTLDRINLHDTYCGDGPYSPYATLTQYIDWVNGDSEKYRKLAYPCVLPLILKAAKDAYAGDCMRTMDEESFFSEEFLATGIIDLVERKQLTSDEINDVVFNHGLTRIDQMVNKKVLTRTKVIENGKEVEKVAFNTSSTEFRCLMRALEMNDLTKGWSPKHNILFMHYTGDEVVPSRNMEMAKNNLLSTGGAKLKFVDHNKVKEQLTPVWSVVNSQLIDAFTNPDHAKMGKFFYVAAASGALKELLHK
ncbi:MAG: hypothetical protein Q4B68_07690 [Bacteroidales bacterium]|nr:hypothetical protein [Bacteroidales bacterium]